MVRQEFEALTLQYLDSLYHFALILTREKNHAEDLVQDTYLRAFRFYHHYESGTNYKAWLFTMMRNLHINKYHRLAREVSYSEVELEEQDDGYEPPTGGSLSNTTALGKGIFPTDIEKALDELPRDSKTVIVLRDIEGFDYKEIAKIIDCPVGTVMSRLWRSRNYLKKRLRDYREERSPGRSRLRIV